MPCASRPSTLSIYLDWKHPQARNGASAILCRILLAHNCICTYISIHVSVYSFCFSLYQAFTVNVPMLFCRSFMLGSHHIAVNRQFGLPRSYTTTLCPLHLLVGLQLQTQQVRAYHCNRSFLFRTFAWRSWHFAHRFS